MASNSTSTKVGHFLAKILGIKLQDPLHQEELARGGSILSDQSAETFAEEPPSTVDWLRQNSPTGSGFLAYLKSLFPFLSWIGFYNWQWFVGDLVAGITIGAVVVPQGMAYASLANLQPEFGLYSSFMGVVVYWFFATSKDITIGPVAVMSTVTGNVVAAIRATHPEYAANVIASALALIAGCIIVFIGLIRCGWIVDLIPLVSLSAFMTGSALNIAVGQVPTMLGQSGFSTRDATYLVTINTLKYLPGVKIDAAMGLTALLLLYLIRYTLNALARKYPKHQRLLFFLNTLRTAFVILLYTMISWLVNRDRRTKPLFKILGTVPRGFQDAGPPKITTELISLFASQLPASVIVMLIEHIAISKSFGRVNNYTINPSQEMVAIGVTNIFGPFVGAYPSTGSFSRTAIKSKAGVRTPLAGVITGVVVLLAIYALTAVFFYIPSASLSAVIIHAVGDLITPPNTVYQFWRVSPFEVFIFFVGVIVTVFSTIEDGIYCTISISAALLLYRVLRAQGSILGKVKIHSVLGDHVIGEDHRQVLGEYDSFNTGSEIPGRNVFLPLGHPDGSNPKIEIVSPYPGIFIYRFTEGFSYPNASHTLEYLTAYIFANTRRTNLVTHQRLGDRPWNDPGTSRKDAVADERTADLPTLKAIIFDFSSVNHVDITSVQQLIDVRNQLTRYAAPDPVDWHFACINNRWAKRALVSAGFGFLSERTDGLPHRWQSIFSVAEIGGPNSAAAQAEKDAHEKEASLTLAHDEENGVSRRAVKDEISPIGGVTPIAETKLRNRRGAAVSGWNRPLFHVDLTNALQSAIANVEGRGEIGSKVASSLGDA